MKKLLIVLVLITLPMAVFAQFYLGATAFYKADPVGLQNPTPSIVDNLAFGADVKLKLAILEGQATALYVLNNSFNVFLDVGVIFDIAILSIGAGVGPNFLIDFSSGAPQAFGFGFNGKAHVDLNFDPIKISVYYIFLLDSITVADIKEKMHAGNVGLSILFML